MTGRHERRPPWTTSRTEGGAARTIAATIAAAGALAAAAAVGGAVTVAGCSTVDLGDSPADINACRPSQRYFVDHIWPELLNMTFEGKTCGQSDCHGTQARQLVVIAPTSTPTPPVPLPPGSDWETLYISTTRQLRCNNIRGSDLYTRPTGIAKHDPGKLIDEATLEDLLLGWVAAP